MLAFFPHRTGVMKIINDSFEDNRNTMMRVPTYPPIVEMFYNAVSETHHDSPK